MNASPAKPHQTTTTMTMSEDDDDLSNQKDKNFIKLHNNGQHNII